MKFEITAQSEECNARTGVLSLSHGKVQTPAFMPVGTQGCVKTVSSEDLEGLGYEMLLANTYHLSLRPGEHVIERLGGLNRFMGWRRPILTDSGGYQVMSLAKRRKISERGVVFQSHLDGAEIDLTPERAIAIQHNLGVDIAMALDVCPPFPADEHEIQKAMDLTHAWAKRCLEAKGENQTLFGIVQGGVYDELRQRSASFVTSLAFDGFAIGGVCVGEPVELQYPVVRAMTRMLPGDKPRYLMGVGRPRDIIHAVKHGVDLFDCVLPTRMARHHALFTLNGVENLLNAKWAEHDGPVDEESVFPGSGRYCAAYLRHLFNAREPLAARIATLHNLAFYRRLMDEISDAIKAGTWTALEARYSKA